jgi:ribonuclease HI
MKIFVELITWQICYDSRAATAALAKTTTEPAVLWDSMQALEKLRGSNTVTLVWIPRHHGMPGDEGNDKLVKEGTKLTELLASPLLSVKKSSGVI